jgi:hypothetical protein
MTGYWAQGRDILHYKGDRRNLDLNHLVGPDAFGGFWKPIAVKYNPTKNVTTVRFEPVPPQDWPQSAIALRAAIEGAKNKREYDRFIATGQLPADAKEQARQLSNLIDERRAYVAKKAERAAQWAAKSS